MSTEQTPDELGYTRPAPAPRAPLVFAVPPSTPEKACRSCAARIFWIDTTGGRRMPVNLDGTSHFANCPNGDMHRKPKPSTVELTTTERRVLGLVHDGVAVPIRQENRFAIASLETKKLIVLVNGLRHEVTDAGKVAHTPKKRAVRT